MTVIGYLGPKGTFTNEAAEQFITSEYGDCARSDNNVSETSTLIPYRTIPDILIDVERGEIDYGIVPIENSTEGSVNVTLDALVHDVHVQIDRELVLPIRHHALARAHIHAGDVQTVYSHPQALAQCRKSIDAQFPNARAIATTSTAEAAERVMQSREEHAVALGTELAASLYDLIVVATDMQDVAYNETRFVRVGRSIGKRTGCDKTSIVFAFGADKPGNLYRALKVFADDGINLTKLESRPAKKSLGDYIFFVDMEGYISDEPIAKALEIIEAQCAFFKLLGSYPRVDYARANGKGI